MAVLGVVMLLAPLLVMIVKGDDQAESDETPIQKSEQTVDAPVLEVEEPTAWEISVQDPELLGIIKQHLDALGGLDRLVECNSFVALGIMQRGTRAIPVTLVRKRPRLWSISYQGSSIEQTDFYDGSQAWRLKQGTGPDERKVKAIEGTKLDGIRATADFDDPIVRYVLAESYPGQREQLSIRLQGRETFEGEPGWWVVLVDDMGAERQVFICEDSGLVSCVKVTFAGRTTTMRYSDYRNVWGLMLPFRKVTTNSDAYASWELIIERYRVDEVVFDVVFTPAAD